MNHSAWENEEVKEMVGREGKEEWGERGRVSKVCVKWRGGGMEQRKESELDQFSTKRKPRVPCCVGSLLPCSS